jgi:hypothetical protein
MRGYMRAAAADLGRGNGRPEDKVFRRRGDVNLLGSGRTLTTTAALHLRAPAHVPARSPRLSFAASSATSYNADVAATVCARV